MLVVILCYLVFGTVSLIHAGPLDTSEEWKRYKIRADNALLHAKKDRSFKRIYKQYDYVEQENSTILQDYGAKKLSKLRFLHIPKTGTTMGATLVHYCCHMDGEYVDVIRQFSVLIPTPMLGKICDMNCLSTQPRSKNGDPWAHIPYRAGPDSGEISITMLRKPEARLASQLAYMMTLGPKLTTTFGFRRVDASVLFQLLIGNYGRVLSMFLPQLKDLKPPVIGEYAFRMQHSISKPTSRPALVFTNSSFLSKAKECINRQNRLSLKITDNKMNTTLDEQFANDEEGRRQHLLCGLRAVLLYPGLFGCQTRMILGRSCFDAYSITQEDVIEAKRRISQEFAFVGITERWNASIHTFHRLYGGAMHSDELIKQRSAKSEARMRQDLLRRAMKEEGAHDIWDSQIYEHADKLLTSRGG